VKEVTLDMVANMQLAIKRCFPKADWVTDRFHVQKLAYEALQELRVKYRWQALEEEDRLLAQAKEKKEAYQLKVFSHGNTLKQLLARSRYLLFKHPGKWTATQKERAD
jgi:transposase